MAVRSTDIRMVPDICGAYGRPCARTGDNQSIKAIEILQVTTRTWRKSHGAIDPAWLLAH